ncbi:hypothetical protein HK104_008734 [Borealophlyctis nickersoniae]|nr:hypothetical protein HK104_008734 [Borealophlyctis nickersoniae]
MTRPQMSSQQIREQIAAKQYTPSKKKYNKQTPQRGGTPVQLQPQAAGIKRSTEEIRHHIEVKRRITDSLISDQTATLTPNTTPFTSLDDAMARLIPYHIYQYPEEDPPLELGHLESEKLLKRAEDALERYRKWRWKERETRAEGMRMVAEKLMMEDAKPSGGGGKRKDGT